MSDTPQRDLSRRDFLRGMTAAGLATLAAGAPHPASAEPVEHPRPTADTCILLWMAGGMAAPETFDPKRYTPFEVGVPADSILCTFPSIPAMMTTVSMVSWTHDDGSALVGEDQDVWWQHSWRRFARGRREP